MSGEANLGRRRRLAALLAVSMLFVGGGGAFIVARAFTASPPAAPAFSETSGRVVSLLTSPCGTRSRPGTCYRPVVDYVVEGRTLQAAARSRYRPAPFRVGDSVPILVGDDGSAWLKTEWDQEQAAKRYEANREKTTLFLLGSLMLGIALLGAVLVAAVLAAKGPPPDEAAPETGSGEGA
jgi:hypothetical protein